MIRWTNKFQHSTKRPAPAINRHKGIYGRLQFIDLDGTAPSLVFSLLHSSTRVPRLPPFTSADRHCYWATFATAHRRLSRGAAAVEPLIALRPHSPPYQAIKTSKEGTAKQTIKTSNAINQSKQSKQASKQTSKKGKQTRQATRENKAINRNKQATRNKVNNITSNNTSKARNQSNQSKQTSKQVSSKTTINAGKTINK